VDIAENRPGPKSTHDQFVEVGDVRTRYRSAGEGKPALILIHGFGVSLECWQFNLEVLGKQFRTVAPDVVWFGKSDKPAREVTGDYFAEFISGFMDAIGVPRAVLVGNSMGGMIAVKTALQYPGRVSGLVLVSSAGFGPELAWWLRLRSVVPITKLLRPSTGTYRFAVRRLVYAPSVVTEDLVNVFVEMARQPGALDAHHRVLRYGADWRGLRPAAVKEIRDQAHAIRIPTLIVWGKQDRVVPVKHAEIARQCIPDARVHIFDQCGHAPMLEKADEFNKLVAEFVANQVVEA
jgi:pimeloyl-ACP methyl ester carboxylesterase